MEQWTLMAPCHFGLESVLKREIYDLGYEITEVQDGKVIYTGDPEAVCLSNIHLRTAERVLLVVGRFRATTFEELFQGIKEIQWEKWLPKNAKFWVTKASSVKSKLFSPSDIQSITKKAMVER
ncbi:MAG TPA: RNA methyltransferase, partial [Lachnospiraceae bacterium]|nr:RNA methyltransferase [Lachnospiraceae bacterium]